MIEPVDVVSLCAGALLLMVVAAAAALAPARRASAIEPAEALRAE